MRQKTDEIDKTGDIEETSKTERQEPEETGDGCHHELVLESDVCG